MSLAEPLALDMGRFSVMRMSQHEEGDLTKRNDAEPKERSKQASPRAKPKQKKKTKRSPAKRSPAKRSPAKHSPSDSALEAIQLALEKMQTQRDEDRRQRDEYERKTNEKLATMQSQIDCLTADNEVVKASQMIVQFEKSLQDEFLPSTSAKVHMTLEDFREENFDKINSIYPSVSRTAFKTACNCVASRLQEIGWKEDIYGEVISRLVTKRNRLSHPRVIDIDCSLVFSSLSWVVVPPKG